MQISCVRFGSVRPEQISAVTDSVPEQRRPNHTITRISKYNQKNKHTFHYISIVNSSHQNLRMKDKVRTALRRELFFERTLVSIVDRQITTATNLCSSKMVGNVIISVSTTRNMCAVQTRL